MLISRTPFRISFFGGGSDYKSWYANHGGAVLSTTIDKYCYITARHLPPFFEEKSRIVWSKIEAVKDNSEIEHPSVRACLQYLGITEGVEIHHTGDLPARSGLGSSSAFTVGLLNALRSLYEPPVLKAYLAREAIHIERSVLKENVGIQDQIACAFGGLNHTAIDKDGRFSVIPLDITQERSQELQDYLLLFFTGVSRTASDIAAQQIASHKAGDKDTELKRIQDMVGEAKKILCSSDDITELGELLHYSWLLKRSLASNISPKFVDDIYDAAREAGAIGGKLLGAGGGGFMLFFAKPEKHEAIKERLKGLLWVPFKFENKGSEIIYGV